MPEGIAANLTPEGLADLVAYLQSLGPQESAGRSTRRTSAPDAGIRRD